MDKDQKYEKNFALTSLGGKVLGTTDVTIHEAQTDILTGAWRLRFPFVNFIFNILFSLNLSLILVIYTETSKRYLIF